MGSQAKRPRCAGCYGPATGTVTRAGPVCPACRAIVRRQARAVAYLRGPAGRKKAAALPPRPVLLIEEP